MENVLHFFRYRHSRKRVSGNKLTSPNQTKASERDRTSVPRISVAGPGEQTQSSVKGRSSSTANKSPIQRGALDSDDDGASESLGGALDKMRHLSLFKNSKKRRSFSEDVVPENNKAESIRSMEKVIGKSLVENLASLDVVEEGLNHFLSGSGPFIKILEDISRIHPAIGLVVAAFKTAWTLDTIRRENDKRIIALYISMKDMMAVLHRLRSISKKKTETKIGQVKDFVGFTLKDISEYAAKDIKECANMCETYSKKRLVVKVLDCGFWQAEFAAYLKRFAKHRQDFDSALLIHIAGGIENAQVSLKKNEEALAQLDEKLKNISILLGKLASPGEKDIAHLVEKKGGIEQVVKKIKSNDSQSDAILRELNEYEQDKFPSSGTGGLPAGKPRNPQNAIEDLRKELLTNQSEVIKKNLETFQRTFDAQQKQFREEIEQVVRKEGENIIRTLTAGSYSRILDEEVQEVWKEMKWGGSVKARHFVMALHDYFTEKWGLDELEQPKDGMPFKRPLRRVFRSAKKEDNDEWALSYLDPVNVQALSEAFDEDASGFITIKEVNEFISSRPDTWSLPHWIAYWAIGWHLTLGYYRDELRGLIAKLLRCLPSVRHENRRAADQYLETMLGLILPLLYSLNAVEEDEILNEKFKVYNEQEEQRLKEMLVNFRYTINGRDGVKLVIGAGRIENRLFPLLYLLIGRHLDIFKIAEKNVLHPSELEEARGSIEAISRVVSDRVKKLEAIFAQQKLRVNDHFRVFANGIFEYTNEPSKFWSTETLLRIDPSQAYSYFFFWNDEDKEPDPSICNYPLSQEPLRTLDEAFRENHLHNTESSESDSEESGNEAADNAGPLDAEKFDNTGGEDTEKPISKLSEQEWNGFGRNANSEFEAQLLSFTFNVNDETPTDDYSVAVKGSILSPLLEDSLLGTCKVIPSGEGITFELVNDKGYQLTGSIPPGERMVMTGTLVIPVPSKGMVNCSFFLEQRMHHTAFYDQYRPSPSDVCHSRPRALWKFAFAAIMAQVSAGNPFCRAFWAERKRAKERFMELLLERRLGKALEQEESDTYWSLRAHLRSEDEEYYGALVNDKLSKMTRHCGYGCDNCGRTIYGARTFCITCIENNGCNTVDFCDRHECVTSQGTPDRKLTIPHLPSHLLVKARRMVFQTMLGKTVRDTKTIRDIIKKLLEDELDSHSKLASSKRRQQSSEGLTCTFCRNRVPPPFWACIECDETTCICMKCDLAGKTAVPRDYDGEHNYQEHVLVKWQTASSTVGILPVEERLARMESKMAEWDASLKEHGQKVDRLLSILSSMGTMKNNG